MPRNSIHQSALYSLLLMIAACFTPNILGQEKAADEKLYWIYLVSGKPTSDLQPAELQKLQAAHLGNFGKLAASGKILIVGPLRDPENKKRGIILVKAKDDQEISKMFEADPYVKEGYMKIVSTPVEIGLGKATPKVTPDKLAEHHLVILEKTGKNSESLAEPELKKNLEYCRSIYDGKRLRFAALLNEGKDQEVAIMIFAKQEGESLKMLMADLPAIKSEALKSATFTLYLSEGSLD